MTTKAKSFPFMGDWEQPTPKALKKANEECCTAIMSLVCDLQDKYGSVAISALADVLSTRIEACAADRTAWDK